MANKRYKAVFTIPRIARTSYKMLLKVQKEHKRSTISIKETESSVTIIAEADDITALRSTLNSVTRDIQVIEAVNGIGSKSSTKQPPR